MSLSVNQNQFKTSLLLNEKLINLIHQPLCLCGSKWKCSNILQPHTRDTTNGLFLLFCPNCGIEKFWSTQREDNFLDDLLWISSKLTGISPTKLGHLLRLLQTGYKEKQQHYGELVKDKLKPTIENMYLQLRQKILQEVKRKC